MILIKFICIAINIICVNKYIFIVIKIKYVNYERISDIYDKVNFTINYTYFIILDNILLKYTQYFIKTHINIIIFDKTIPQRT